MDGSVSVSVRLQISRQYNSTRTSVGTTVYFYFVSSLTLAYALLHNSDTSMYNVHLYTQTSPLLICYSYYTFSFLSLHPNKTVLPQSKVITGFNKSKMMFFATTLVGDLKN